MITILLTLAFLFFFFIGYRHGRRVERWAQNHPKDDSPKDGVKDFLDNLKDD